MTEIDLYRPSPTEVAAFRPLDDWIPVLAQVVDLASQIHNSPFVPEGLRGSVPAVSAAILAGRELGIPPMTALANIHLIKGKTGLSALLMRALIQSQGHEWQDIEVSDTRVVIRGRRRGEAEWTTAMFTRDQAAKARIDLGGYPQDKLYARASVRLARRKFADVIAGMPYSAEELEDGELEHIAEDTPPPPEANGVAPAATPARGRTAQRKTRQTADYPKSGASPAATSSTPAAGSNVVEIRPEAPPAAAQQPLLPGEDDQPAPGPDAASRGQVGIIRQHFTRLGFGDDEREQRLKITARIAGRLDTIASTSDLSKDQALAVSDTLARCKNRDKLIALLAEGDKPDA